MNRREALKNVGFAAGFLIATPTIISLLQSCKTDSKTWIPKFFTPEEGIVLENIVDIIIPKTDLPSATDLNIPQFIDKYAFEVLEKEEQLKLKNAFKNLTNIIKPISTDNIKNISQDEYKSLLDNNMFIKGEIDEERQKNPEGIDLTTSEFLNIIKNMTISAFLNNENIAENVLAYDPIPGAYYCGDLQNLTGGKSWSLNQ